MRYNDEAERERLAMREALRKPTRVQAGPPPWVKRALAKDLPTKDMTGKVAA